MKKYWEKWKGKKLFDKITDILFIILVIVMLTPEGRTAITVTLKRLIAFSPREIKSEERLSVAEEDYHWKLETLSGNIINLTDYAGKTIFINLWATWCPPCIAEMPSIQKLYENFKDDSDVVFLIISNEKKETVKNFVIENNYTFPVMLARSKTPESFYSPSVPTTFLVSPNGEIVMKEVGSKKWHGEETVKLIQSF